MIRYLYSGGISNIDPALSIGGLPSNHDIGDGIDALFPRVTQELLTNGGITYRCIYLLNQSMIMFDNVRIWTDGSISDGNIEIGIQSQNEVQRLLMTGPVSGTFGLQYTANVAGVQVSQVTDPITWTPNLQQMTTDLQNSLNDLGLLGGISVQSLHPSQDIWVYDIAFAGINSLRNQMLLEIVDNAMLGIDLVMTVTTLVEGQSVNSQAPNIGFDNQAPHGVEFIAATLEEPVTVGLVEPFDIFGVWIKRTVTAGFTPNLGSEDSVVLNFTWQE